MVTRRRHLSVISSQETSNSKVQSLFSQTSKAAPKALIYLSQCFPSQKANNAENDTTQLWCLI